MQPKNEIAELLKHVDTDELNRFLIKYAEGNHEFATEILTHFHVCEAKNTLDDYREAAASCFPEPTHRYRRGYDPYDAACQAELLLGSLLQRASYYATHSNPAEASVITRAVIEVIPRKYETVDDSSGGVGGVFNEAVEQLTQIIENKNTPATLQQELFEWVATEARQTVYYDYDFDNIETLVIPSTLATGRVNEALDLADDRIRSASNKYKLRNATLDKINLLEKVGMETERNLVIEENLSIADVRRIKVEKLQDQGEYHKAMLLIREGIKIAESNDEPGTVSDWKDQLLHLMIKNGDKDEATKLALDLFHNGRDAMAYYPILKQHIPPSEWPGYVEKLLAELNRPWSKTIQAKIFINEGYIDRLMAHVKEHLSDSFEEYEKHLEPHYPEEMVRMYSDKVIKYAEMNMGRRHYEYVAKIIRKIRSYPNGNAAAEALLDDFKLRYRTRKSMMKELAGV